MATSVSLSELWTLCQPALVAVDASPAQREFARRAFYSGAVAILGALAEASRDGNMERVKLVLERVRREIPIEPERRLGLPPRH
ncbi:MAG TPA: hypothetical protein VMG11_03235 [Steroidobacteraceae bacterium]|nr:hypothetical protein [Steroidobacteraceae bacterium]